jgi:hypothetical protein
MKFTSKYKKHKLIIIQREPDLVNASGGVIKRGAAEVSVKFEPDSSETVGYFDTDEPRHIWNVDKTRKSLDLKEQVENKLLMHPDYKAGIIKKYDKPKKFKMVEVKDEETTPEDRVVELHDNAEVDTEKVFSEDELEKEIAKEQ